VLALVLAFAAAHYYTAPNLNGSARVSAWLEPDSCLALASSLLALGAGIYAGARRDAIRARRSSLPLAPTLSWLVLTVLLGAVWASAVALLTLLIAPSHAFAAVRLAGLLRAWNSERLWAK